MLNKILAIKDLPDGYRFEFPGSAFVFSAISEWVLLERLCCPFLTFSLEIDQDAEPILLTLRGPLGVKQSLTSELQIPQP